MNVFMPILTCLFLTTSYLALRYSLKYKEQKDLLFWKLFEIKGAYSKSKKRKLEDAYKIYAQLEFSIKTLEKKWTQEREPTHIEVETLDNLRRLLSLMSVAIKTRGLFDYVLLASLTSELEKQN